MTTAENCGPDFRQSQTAGGLTFMSVAREWRPAYAGRHDWDKLGCWKLGLDAADAAPFPVCAIFMVSAQDRVAYDIFRRYRRFRFIGLR